MKALERHLQLLLDTRDWKRLGQAMAALDPHQAAEIITDIRIPQRALLFRLLPTASAAAVVESLQGDARESFITMLCTQIRAGVYLPAPEADDDLRLEELPGCIVRHLLERLSATDREALFRYLGYSETCIGGMIRTGFIALRPEFTTEEAFEQIRRYGAGTERFDRLYVVDGDWRLLRTIGIRDLLLAAPGEPISRIGALCCTVLRADEEREAVAARFRSEGPASLPVTDSAGTLLGVVSSEEILRIEREEATEDFQKFGGAEELELSYTRTPLFSLVRKRAGWLVVLFLSEMLTASAMGHFDDEIARAVVLALFVPLVISSGGNSGSQAASLIIRALALGELSMRNIGYVLRKELLSGLLLGAILGAIGFIRIVIWQATGLYDYGPFWGWVGVSVAVSLLFIVLWGTLAGAMIPLLLKRIGLDPATASAPFVATLADVTGLVIYFSVAALFLTGKLL